MSGPSPRGIAKPTETIRYKSWEEMAGGLPAFQTNYDEGLKVGYKWYDAEHKAVLFPFGYGLSYTTYSYSSLKITQGKNVNVSFTVTNTGNRSGSRSCGSLCRTACRHGRTSEEVGGLEQSEIGGAGESKEVSVEVDAEYLSVFNVDKDAWELPEGEFRFMVGGSSQSLMLQRSIRFQ